MMLNGNNMNLIFYFQGERKKYQEIKKHSYKYFQRFKNSDKNSNLIRILVGSQSLFYYLGWTGQHY